MRRTAVICFAILAVFAFVESIKVQEKGDSLEDVHKKSFSDWMIKHNKQYETQEEFTVRFENFKASMERVAKKNEKAKGKTVYGLNKFSDMTPEEFRQKMLLPQGIPADKREEGVEVLEPTVAAVPTAFDWRELGAVTPVKDQEQCGSCWAFSTTEAIESAWILAGKATNETVDLAPQQIVDCDSSDGGCNGGEPGTAYDYVISAGGLESESSYPYEAVNQNCNFNAKDVTAKISSWKYATSLYSETTLQKNLVSWGPLSVCVDASSWQDYTSGVMTWEDCAWVNLLDHCVQLVGYAVDPQAGPYWIVRNSWNTDWGVNGFIYLEMWRDTCGIAHQATWPTI